MTGHDASEFAMAMADLERAYRTRVAPETIRMYAKGLEDLPWPAVRTAMEAVVKTSKTFPSVAAIREAVASSRATPNAGTRRGTYPPDIAARRRALGLPVTPEEFAAYEAETEHGSGRSLSRVERAAILRESVRTTKSIVYRAAVLRMAERLERGEAVSDAEMLEVFTGAVRRHREPRR